MRLDLGNLGMPKNPTRWYEAHYWFRRDGGGRVDAVMDVLATTHSEAVNIAVGCMEPGQELSVVAYRGTYDQYQEEQRRIGETDDYALDDCIDLVNIPEEASEVTGFPVDIVHPCNAPKL